MDLTPETIALILYLELRWLPPLLRALVQVVAHERATSEKVGVDPASVAAHVERAQVEFSSMSVLEVLGRLARRGGASVAIIGAVLLVACASPNLLRETRRSWELYKRATVPHPSYDGRGVAAVESLSRAIDGGFDAAGAPVESGSSPR